MAWTIKNEFKEKGLHGVMVRDLEGDGGLIELSVMPETVLSEIMRRIEQQEVYGDYLMINGLLYVPMEMLEEL